MTRSTRTTRTRPTKDNHQTISLRSREETQEDYLSMQPDPLLHIRNANITRRTHRSADSLCSRDESRRKTSCSGLCRHSGELGSWDQQRLPAPGYLRSLHEFPGSERVERLCSKMAGKSSKRFWIPRLREPDPWTRNIIALRSMPPQI